MTVRFFSQPYLLYKGGYLTIGVLDRYHSRQMRIGKVYIDRYKLYLPVYLVDAW
jgi:hypothetical protein